MKGFFFFFSKLKHILVFSHSPLLTFMMRHVVKAILGFATPQGILYQNTVFECQVLQYLYDSDMKGVFSQLKHILFFSLPTADLHREACCNSYPGV